MSVRLHPQSAAELTRLIKLHGSDVIIEATREIAHRLRTEIPPRCPAQLEAGPRVYTCTAAAGHVGEHRHGERSW